MVSIGILGGLNPRDGAQLAACEGVGPPIVLRIDIKDFVAVRGNKASSPLLG